jgi:membrane-anchored mycosin MYCP
MTIRGSESSADGVRSVSLPESEITPDQSGRKIAFGGAGICVAVISGAVAMTASLSRLRRQGKTVARD